MKKKIKFWIKFLEAETWKLEFQLIWGLGLLPLAWPGLAGCGCLLSGMAVLKTWLDWIRRSSFESSSSKEWLENLNLDSSGDLMNHLLAGSWPALSKLDLVEPKNQVLDQFGEGATWKLWFWLIWRLGVLLLAWPGWLWLPSVWNAARVWQQIQLIVNWFLQDLVKTKVGNPKQNSRAWQRI